MTENSHLMLLGPGGPAICPHCHTNPAKKKRCRHVKHWSSSRMFNECLGLFKHKVVCLYCRDSSSSSGPSGPASSSRHLDRLQLCVDWSEVMLEV
eukprot:4912138-Amphidinium_carterae.1